MKREYMAVLYIFAVIFLFTACSTANPPNHLTGIATQIENAIPTEYDKQYEMETSLLFTAEGKHGHTIAYYLIVTTYYAADPVSVTQLHKDALSTVFDVNRAECIKEFDASGHAAAIYSLDGCNYACCTTSPETSVVMEYPPDAVTQEESVNIIQSIFGIIPSS